MRDSKLILTKLRAGQDGLQTVVLGNGPKQDWACYEILTPRLEGFVQFYLGTWLHRRELKTSKFTTAFYWSIRDDDPIRSIHNGSASANQKIFRFCPLHTVVRIHTYILEIHLTKSRISRPFFQSGPKSDFLSFYPGANSESLDFSR